MYEELVHDLQNWSKAWGKEPNPVGPVPIKHLAEAADAIEELSKQNKKLEDAVVDEKNANITKEQIYLFVFEDDTTYEMCCGISLKDAVWEMAKYTGGVSELFRKSLFSDKFGENDVNDIINLFNHWCYYPCIKSVYVVKEKLFPIKEDNE